MYDELTFEHCDHSRDPIIGCALEGVANIIAGIKEVSVVIHSPQGCSSTVASAYDHHEIDFSRRKVACTRLFEMDIIMGATEKLRDLIHQADTTFKSKVMFVVGTCAADIIGENLNDICTEMQPEINAKLIPVMAGGFRGTSYDGMEIGLEILLPFIQQKKGEKIPKTVNIIAPQATINPTWWADLNWITKILGEMGVSVQTVISHETTLDQLAEAASASANILLSHDVGYGFAKKMETLFDIPLILADIPLPIGCANTAQWLTAAGNYFGAKEVAEKHISDGEEMVVEILRRRGLMIIPRYRNCSVAISADATYGIGLLRMLFEEVEMIPKVILIRSDNPHVRALMDQELAKLGISPKVAFGIDGYAIKEALVQSNVDAVLGSAWERYISEEVGIKQSFDLLSPTNRDIYLDKVYFGYEGMLNILEIIGNDWEAQFRSKEIHWEHYKNKTPETKIKKGEEYEDCSICR